MKRTTELVPVEVDLLSDINPAADPAMSISSYFSVEAREPFPSMGTSDEADGMSDVGRTREVGGWLGMGRGGL